MNIVRILSFYFSVIFLSHSVVAMQAPQRSRTLEDLRNIAQYYNVVLNTSYANTDDEIDGLCQSIRVAGYSVAAQALELGADLLKSVVAIEIAAAQKDFTMWWRYSNGVDADIATGKNKSFGRTLLAGFVNDGLGHFKDGALGFDTACTFIYWVNCRYFDGLVFDDNIKVFVELEEFVLANDMQFDFFSADDVAAVKEFYQNLKLSPAIEFYTNKALLKQEEKFEELALKLILQIQHHANYRADQHRTTIGRLYSIYQRAYFAKSPSYIKNAIAGELFLLPMGNGEEKVYLRDRWNYGVAALEDAARASGEEFHPRLSSTQLSANKDNLISVYANSQLVDGEILSERVSTACDREVKEYCADCGKSPAKLLLCSRCKKAKYCSASCQRKDWPCHKAVCHPKQ